MHMIISLKTCYMRYISWIVLLFHHFCTLLDSLFLHDNHIIHLIPVILPQLLLFPCNLLFLCIWCNIGIWFYFYFFKNYIFMCFCPASQLNFNSQRQNYFYFSPSFSLVPSLCQVSFETSNTYWIFNLYISSMSHDIQGL